MLKKLAEFSQEELVVLVEKERAEAEAFKKAKEEELAAKNAEIEARTKEVSEASAIIEDLQLELETALAGPKKEGFPTVTIGKKVFQITVPKFIWEGKELTAGDLSKDKKLAEELVKIGSGILSEVK